MSENPSMVIKQELFDRLVNSQVALFKQIERKMQNNEPVSQEEVDFANTFLEYAKELTIVVQKQVD